MSAVIDLGASRWSALVDLILSVDGYTSKELHAAAKATFSWAPSKRAAVADVRLAASLRELARAVADAGPARRLILAEPLRVLATELRDAMTPPEPEPARAARMPYAD